MATDSELLMPAAPQRLPLDDGETIEFQLRGECVLKFRRKRFVIGVSVVTVITNLMLYVTLPLFSGTIDVEDDYPAQLLACIWFPVIFAGMLILQKVLAPDSLDRRSVLVRTWRSYGTCALLGWLNSINDVLLIYASDPSRTSPSIQPLLRTSILPFTVLSRWLIIRKGVSKRKLVCVGIVLIGFFISLEPEIFGLKQDSTGNSESNMWSIWPLIFVVGEVPEAIYLVLIERKMKQEGHERERTVAFLFWVSVFNTLFTGLLFWTDFIPGFGEADDWDDFTKTMKYGAQCFYGKVDDPFCDNAPMIFWIRIISYCLAYFMFFVMIQFGEGAVYLVVLMVMTTPFGILFFIFFDPSPTYGGNPAFDYTLAYRIGGLIIIITAVSFYHYFTEREIRQDRTIDINSL